MPEDFTTYTEVDPNDHITRTVSRVTFTGLIRDESAYVYDDKNAGHFGDFEHLLDFCIDTIIGTSVRIRVALWGVTNEAADFKDFDNGIVIDLFNNTGSTTEFKIRIRVKSGGNWGNSDTSSLLNVDTPYYLTITREGSITTCKIYSDADRINLVDTISIDSGSTTYRYIIVSQSMTNTVEGTLSITGYVENLDLEGMSVLSGVTRDANGNPLGNCTVCLFRTSNKKFIEEKTSDVNGNFSFSVIQGTEYFIRAHKDGTPNVFGTTDDNLTGEAE